MNVSQHVEAYATSSTCHNAGVKMHNSAQDPPPFSLLRTCKMRRELLSRSTFNPSSSCLSVLACFGTADKVTGLSVSLSRTRELGEGGLVGERIERVDVRARTRTGARSPMEGEILHKPT